MKIISATTLCYFLLGMAALVIAAQILKNRELDRQCLAKGGQRIAQVCYYEEVKPK